MELIAIKPGCVKTITELASIAGVHRRNVSDWQKREGFPVEPDGTFNIWKIASWREKTFNLTNKQDRACSLEGVNLEEMKDRRIVAEALSAEEDAKAKELKNRQTEGELVSRTAAKQWVSQEFATIRQRFEAYPAEVATDFPEATRSDNVENFKRFIQLNMRRMASRESSFEGEIE